MTKRPPLDLASPDDVIELKRQKIEVTQEISAETDGTVDGTAGGSLSEGSAELNVRIDGTVDSTLFKLPAELRVVIYEYVLIEDQNITVDTELRLPSLHSISRQVREETMTIWYHGNEFLHPVVDCKADLATAWNKHCRQLKIRNINDRMLIQGVPDWSNLMRWCQVLCDPSGVGMLLPADDDPNALEKVIAAANGVAQCFWTERRPWVECELILMLMRPLLGFYDARWLK
ncbi:hypothetical protein LTS10_010299 [Elasticomyces elasticus]|nr:hypothetical protein LTS10_010299 [Elasticomyces elasticus]